MYLNIGNSGMGCGTSAISGVSSFSSEQLDEFCYKVGTYINNLNIGGIKKPPLEHFGIKNNYAFTWCDAVEGPYGGGAMLAKVIIEKEVGNIWSCDPYANAVYGVPPRARLLKVWIWLPNWDEVRRRGKIFESTLNKGFGANLTIQGK